MYKKILALISIIILIVLFSWNTPNKPNEQIIINILSDNTITINGSDSNIINPQTNCPPDHISILIQKQEIKKIQIIESGYDFINKKYFCLFEFNSYSRDEYVMTAKAIMLLHYDQGWKLIDKIGVLDSNYELYKYR